MARFVLSIYFDGTLIDGNWDIKGTPRLDVVAKTKEFCDHPNCDVILWTCREEFLLAEAIERCESWGLKFAAVNTNTFESLNWSLKHFGRLGATCGRKIFADIYVDDKSPGSIEYFLKLDPETEWRKIEDKKRATVLLSTPQLSTH